MNNGGCNNKYKNMFFLILCKNLEIIAENIK